MIWLPKHTLSNKICPPWSKKLLLTPWGRERQCLPSLKTRKPLKDAQRPELCLWLYECFFTLTCRPVDWVWPQWQHLPKTLLQASLSQFPWALAVRHAGWFAENTTEGPWEPTPKGRVERAGSLPQNQRLQEPLQALHDRQLSASDHLRFYLRWKMMNDSLVPVPG